MDYISDQLKCWPSRGRTMFLAGFVVALVIIYVAKIVSNL
jgi:hypothetical protein